MSTTRTIERSKMRVEIAEYLKKHKSSWRQARHDLFSLRVKPSLKNMYEYVVLTMKSVEKEKGQ